MLRPDVEQSIRVEVREIDEGTFVLFPNQHHVQEVLLTRHTGIGQHHTVVLPRLAIMDNYRSCASIRNVTGWNWRLAEITK